jgi:hypothetical protein
MDDMLRLTLSSFLKKHFKPKCLDGNIVKEKFSNSDNDGNKKKNSKSLFNFVISFNKYIKHFCIHAGGYKLINDIWGNLGLNEQDLEPSFSTLYRYGLLSGTSPWYQLSFLGFFFFYNCQFCFF